MCMDLQQSTVRANNKPPAVPEFQSCRTYVRGNITFQNPMSIAIKQMTRVVEHRQNKA